MSNIYTFPTHEKSISDDSIPLKGTYFPSSLGYSARILFTTQEGIILLTPLPNLACINQQNCLQAAYLKDLEQMKLGFFTFYLTLLYCMSTLVYPFLPFNNYWYLIQYSKQMK